MLVYVTIPLLLIVHLVVVVGTVESTESGSYASYFSSQLGRLGRHEAFKSGVFVLLCKAVFWASCRLGVCGVACITLNCLTKSLYDDHGGCVDWMVRTTLTPLDVKSSRWYQYMYATMSSIVLCITAVTIAALNSNAKHVSRIYPRIVDLFRNSQSRSIAIQNWKERAMPWFYLTADPTKELGTTPGTSGTAPHAKVLHYERMSYFQRTIRGALYHLLLFLMCLCASAPSVL